MSKVLDYKVWDNLDSRHSYKSQPWGRSLGSSNGKFEGFDFELGWPEAILVHGADKEDRVRIITNGITVCSAVAIGFANAENNKSALFMNHAQPWCHEFLGLSIRDAIKIAHETGYTPTFTSMIGAGDGVNTKDFDTLERNVRQSLSQDGLEPSVSMYVPTEKLIEWEAQTEWPVPKSHTWQLDLEAGKFSVALNSDFTIGQ